jgi:hypothetical protein
MRTFLITAAAALAFASPAAAATRSFTITSFDKVRVDGPFRISLTTGIAPFARATGSPSAIDRVAIEVRDDTLVIRTNLDSWGGYPGQDIGPVELILGTHDIRSASLVGSGSVTIDKVSGLSFDLSVQGSGVGEIGDAAVDQLRVSVVGTASAKLTGHAGKLTAFARGITAIDASALEAKDATIGAEGAATIKADVAGTAKVDAAGPATIALAGRPACTLHMIGSASITGCR